MLGIAYIKIHNGIRIGKAKTCTTEALSTDSACACTTAAATSTASREAPDPKAPDADG